MFFIIWLCLFFMLTLCLATAVIRILQRNRTRACVHTHICYKLLTHDYGGGEGLQSAVWSERPRRPRGVVQRPESKRAHSADCSSGGMRAKKKINVSALIQSGREGISPSTTFLFYSGHEQIGWWPPTLGRAICFIQSTYPDAKHPRGHSQKWCLTSYLFRHHLAQSHWYIKWTITATWLNSHYLQYF